MIVLSHIQVTPLLKAHPEPGNTYSISLDLNQTQSEVQITADGIILPDDQQLTWEQLKKILAEPNACYLIQNSSLERILFFSPQTKRVASLLPTAGAPTMLLASFPMHRIKGIDPMEDTRRKMATVAPVMGRVLDTTTGLGYTSIAAAKTATKVVTIELDPAVLEVARRNPWSEALFSDPKIQQMIGSSFDIVPTLPDSQFTRIFHDPPTFKLAGELYSQVFYEQLYRVLARNGRLYHYIGDLNSESGQRVAKGVVRRLQEAGFQRVAKRQDAFGLVADKG